MKFETILYAAAFLALAAISLPGADAGDVEAATPSDPASAESDPAPAIAQSRLADHDGAADSTLVGSPSPNPAADDLAAIDPDSRAATTRSASLN